MATITKLEFGSYRHGKTYMSHDGYSRTWFRRDTYISDTKDLI